MQLSVSKKSQPGSAYLATGNSSAVSEFDSFIVEFRRRYLAGLSRSQFLTVAEQRASVLSSSAMTRGYRTALASAYKPYRGVIEYLSALHDMQSSRHFRG